MFADFYAQFNRVPSVAVLVQKLYELASYFDMKGFSLVKVNVGGQEHSFSSSDQIAGFADSLLATNISGTVH